MLTFIIIASGLLSVLWSIRPRIQESVHKACVQVLHEIDGNCPPYWVVNICATIVVLVLNYFKYMVILLFVYLIGRVISPDIFPVINW